MMGILGLSFFLESVGFLFLLSLMEFVVVCGVFESQKGYHI